MLTENHNNKLYPVSHDNGGNRPENNRPENRPELSERELIV
jgi:hypothetical protein